MCYSTLNNTPHQYLASKPDCLCDKQVKLCDLTQAPNPSLYELLQLLAENQVASTEIADLDMAILKAFLKAFYSDTPGVDICAATSTITPQEAHLAELLALLDARGYVDTLLKGNVAAFAAVAQKWG